jgi:hypothetical protein
MLLCDNENSIKLVKNPIFHSITKYITIHYHFVREKFESGEISKTYILFKNQIADMFIKLLEKALFEEFRDELQVFSFRQASL